MRKRLVKVFNIIIVLILTNVIITEGAKGFYDNDAYFWFDLSNYARYVVYDLIIIGLLFIINVPIQLRLLMMVYVVISLKDAITYVINGNTGNVVNDVWIFAFGVLVIIYKSVIDWSKKQSKIKPFDLKHIYRVSKPSKTILTTLLGFAGEDCESVKYYANGWLYKFDKKSSSFTKKEIDSWDIEGGIQKIACDSIQFSNLMDMKLGTKYNQYNNNCENVANDAKKALGLKTRRFPQINLKL